MIKGGIGRIGPHALSPLVYGCVEDTGSFTSIVCFTCYMHAIALKQSFLRARIKRSKNQINPVRLKMFTCEDKRRKLDATTEQSLIIQTERSQDQKTTHHKPGPYPRTLRRKYLRHSNTKILVAAIRLIDLL